MQYRFSKKTGNFLPDCFDYKDPPDDLIDVTPAEYAAASNRSPGETLDVIDGKLVIVPAPVPDFAAALAEAKSKALAHIAEYAKSQRIALAGTSDEIEIASRNNKQRIASAIVAGTATDSDIAIFETEILERAKGETLDGFVQSVLEKADFYGKAVALIDGIKKRAQDLVAAASTLDDVEQALLTTRKKAQDAFNDLMESRHGL